ncbi:somatostatin receptor type 5-like [Convolutriloba macropyga]|uniref:somatostatin receptor type 5-like n=1 Tax=Convolutriloba macropyga TaxID=536237 RepID=UPI003F523581
MCSQLEVENDQAHAQHEKMQDNENKFTWSEQSEDIGDVCSSSAAPPYDWLLTLILGTLAMTGNGLVAVVYIMRKVEHNATNLIITNLSVVDFLSGLFLVFIKSFPRLPKPEGTGFMAQVVCRLYCSEYPLWALLNSSVFNLLLVAVDRYLSIVVPFFHKLKFSKPKVLYTCIVVTWIMGSIMAGYNLIHYGVSGDVCEVDFSLPKWVFIWGGYWSFFGMLMVPSLLMLMAYAHISYTLSKMSESSQGKKLQKKVTISCFAVLAVFFFCWFPDQLYFFLYSLNLPSLNITMGDWLYHLVVNVGFSNSCLNPFLYAFLNPNYKRVFKKIFGLGTEIGETTSNGAKSDATK